MLTYIKLWMKSCVYVVNPKDHKVTLTYDVSRNIV